MFLIVRCHGAIPSDDGFLRSAHLTPPGVVSAKRIGELFVARVGYALHQRSALVFYQKEHRLSSAFHSTLSAVAAGASLTYPQAVPSSIDEMVQICEAHKEGKPPVFLCAAEDRLGLLASRCAYFKDTSWNERIFPGQALLVDTGRAEVLGSPVMV